MPLQLDKINVMFLRQTSSSKHVINSFDITHVFQAVEEVQIIAIIIMPPFEERGGDIALHLSVGPSVGRSVDHIFVRSITQKNFQVSS